MSEKSGGVSTGLAVVIIAVIVLAIGFFYWKSGKPKPVDSGPMMPGMMGNMPGAMPGAQPGGKPAPPTTP